tara:strand:- start:135 stop:683 length:549 start_codon:yes stop_codon:yes gene_type:complete
MARSKSKDSKISSKSKSSTKTLKVAPGAYAYFMKEKSVGYKPKGEKLERGELMKHVGALWKAASDKEHEKYEKLAVKEKARMIKEGIIDDDETRERKREEAKAQAKVEKADIKQAKRDEKEAKSEAIALKKANKKSKSVESDVESEVKPKRGRKPSAQKSKNEDKKVRSKSKAKKGKKSDDE